MSYKSKQEELKQINETTKVSLKYIKKQILDIMEKVGDISFEELYSYFFPKRVFDTSMFYNAFILPLVFNQDIEIVKLKVDGNNERGKLLEQIVLKRKEARKNE